MPENGRQNKTPANCKHGSLQNKTQMEDLVLKCQLLTNYHIKHTYMQDYIISPTTPLTFPNPVQKRFDEFCREILCFFCDSDSEVAIFTGKMYYTYKAGKKQ